MSYKYATEHVNYEDYASGRVLYNQQGATSFPVRLASEIFQRCAAILQKAGHPGPYRIYDPCCGGGYLLTTLGLLHGQAISTIYASDIDEDVIPLAQRNLSLLSSEGLHERCEQIQMMIDEYGKLSHQEALQSAVRFREMLAQRGHTIVTHCFAADATQSLSNQKQIEHNIDMVITDLPYGDLVEWSGQADEYEAITRLLHNLLSVLAPHAVVGIVSTKKVKIQHEQYQKIEHFSIGKRRVVLLRPLI